jgi:nitrilase
MAGDTPIGTVAVAQIGAALGQPEKTLAELERSCQDCYRRGIQLVVFPEALIGGYPKGLVFGASLGIRTEAGRRLFRAYADGAIEVPGPTTDTIGGFAKAFSLYLVVGVVERDGGTLYCTALYFGPDGALLGKHRKLVPTAIERVIWGCGNGSTLRVFDSPVGRFGALICWENYMPLARMAMYQQGIELYCAPTVDDRESWIPTLRHIAREGRCFVLSSCQFLTADAYPADWLEVAQDLPAVPIRGGSCIVDPMGEIISGPLYGEAGLLVANIDLAQLTEAKFDFDVSGHYARPDVFELRISRRAGDNGASVGRKGDK